MPLFRGRGSRRNAVPESERPPVKAIVQAGLADGSRYETRIVMRRDGLDYLDALKDDSNRTLLDTDLVGGDLILYWGQDDFLYQFPVRVREVLAPLPALEVEYPGPPTRHNRRRQGRAYARPHMAFVRSDTPDRGDALARGPFDTITRDISLAAIRFFTPRALKTDERVQVALDLDDGPLRARMRILRTSRYPSAYRHQDGYDAVGVWDPDLTDPDLARWLLYFRRHRWDL
jgi:hypothetical protein